MRCIKCCSDVVFATTDGYTLYWYCICGCRWETPDPNPRQPQQLSLFNPLHLQSLANKRSNLDELSK